MRENISRGIFMKQSISIAVVYIFILNTVLSSVGRAAEFIPNEHMFQASGVTQLAKNAKREVKIRKDDGNIVTLTSEQLDGTGIFLNKFSYAGPNLVKVGGNTADEILAAYAKKTASETTKSTTKSIIEVTAESHTNIVPDPNTPKAAVSSSFAQRPGKYSYNAISFGPKSKKENQPVINSDPATQLTGETATSTIDAPVSVISGDANSGGKSEDLLHPVGTPILNDVTPEQKKEIYTEYKPSKLRKMFEQDRQRAMADVREQAKKGRRGMREAIANADWEKSIWGAQTRRFPLETMMFFFSLSLINGGMLIADYSQNPLVLEQHLKSLVDPLGHLSFYSFMIVNGYATEFLQDRGMAHVIRPSMIQSQMARTFEAGTKLGFNPQAVLGDAANYADKTKTWNIFRSTTAKEAYIKMIPYLGMTAGSMASHFTGDFARTMQACVQSFYKPGEKPKEAGKEKTESTLKKDRLNHLSEDPCDTAWREWTLEKKFNQYAPALVSMLMSTWASGKLTSLFNDFKKTPAYRNTSANLKKGAVATFRFGRMEVAAGMLTGLFGGLGKAAIGLVGHFTSITLFTTLDTLINSWVEDVILNLTYGRNFLIPNPNSFPRKAEALYDLLEKESKEKFSTDSPACEKDIQSGECKKTDIEGFLYNFSESVEKWKEFNQTKAHQAHSQWVEQINKYQHMEQLSKDYYVTFVDDLKTAYDCLKDTAKCNAQKESSLEHNGLDGLDEMEKKGIQAASRPTPPMVNQRLFPLYGVEPKDEGTDLTNWKNLYLSQNYLLQESQQRHANDVGIQLESYLNQRGLGSDLTKYKDIFQKIVDGLKSKDYSLNARSIDMMRSIENESGGVPEVVRQILYDHLRLLGNPAPLMNYGQGFSYAFEVSTAHNELVKKTEIPDFFRHLSLSTRYSFSKKTDYLEYNMACGPHVETDGQTSDGKSKSLTDKVFGFSTLFTPPRIIGANNDMDICRGIFGFSNSSVLYSQKITDTNSKLTYNGIFHAIFNNLSPSIKEIIKSEKFAYTDEDKKNRAAQLAKPLFSFDQWWEKNVEGQVANQLETFKHDYENIAVKFQEAQFKDDGTVLGFIPTNSGVMQNSVVVSSMQASRTFALVLAEVAKSILTGDEYKDLLVDPKTLPGLKGKKLGNKDDILAFQAGPWLQDFSALRSGGLPSVFKFQNDNEMVLAQLYAVLKSTKVVKLKDKDGSERPVVTIEFPDLTGGKGYNDAPDYAEMKREDDFEKKISEMNIELEKSIEVIIERINKKIGEVKNQEVPKPIRVINFSKDKMLQLSQDLLATISTIRFAAFEAAKYSNKDQSDEDKKRWATKAEREQKRVKCIESKRMGTVTKGGGC